MKIAAASCTRFADDTVQPVWTEILAEQPDVLLLMGDNVYLKSDSHTDPVRLETGLKHRYAEQFGVASFAALLADMKARGRTVRAIYDDHDFLGNNRYGGDVDVALREAARNAFVAAFAPPMNGRSVFSVTRLGLVDVVVLDCRFYRRNPAASGSDRNAMLGTRQWTWLEATLAAPTRAKYTVIVSSTTFHSFGNESWEQYPVAANRLRTLVGARPGTLVLSGDIHRNTVYDDDGVLELVTSGAARFGQTYGGVRRNYGILTFARSGMTVDLRSLKAGGRFGFTVPLKKWVIP